MGPAPQAPSVRNHAPLGRHEGMRDAPLRRQGQLQSSLQITLSHCAGEGATDSREGGVAWEGSMVHVAPKRLTCALSVL
ncbi:hypothetical protein F751_0146 [Auxenochlorella protothecoides]|uniref:Uncharacterized protein n=1 Tax=Auxenochlorella protothecoides TaxID=3075 RepID=A0A087S9J5_AUXPR|nr:hypothetical protein F751_0146 [Auxenochlorella protothecoides]KFM22399.1 hypothetical protein F751_0146 [Auxenochlorella protothecoides]